MRGIGEHCTNCPNLLIGAYAPYCCKVGQLIPLLVLKGCPEHRIASAEVKGHGKQLTLEEVLA